MSAVSFVVYDEVTGQIYRSGMCVDEDLILQGQAEPVGVVMEVQTHQQQYRDWYVDVSATPPVIVARTALAAPDTTTPAVDAVVTWAAIPGGTQVVVTGPGNDLWTHDAGDLEISFAAPGAYTVRLFANPPYADREDVINVSA